MQESELKEAPQLQDTIFVPAGAGETLHILGSTHITKIAPEQTGDQFTALEIVVPPHCGAPMHSHATDSEFFYVLEGTLTISDPDGDIEARPGDFCFLRAGGSHAFRNNSEQNARALVMVTPGIDAHRFFKSIDARAHGQVDVPALIAKAGHSHISVMA